MFNTLTTSLSRKAIFPSHKNKLLSILLSRNLTWILTSVIITAQSQTFPSFPKLLNAWSLYSFSPTLNSQDFSLLVNQASGLIIQLKLSFCPCSLTSTPLLIDLNLHCWLSLMFLQPLTWLTITFCCNASRPPLASEAFLFSGSVLTLLVVLKWLFVVTLELPGSWSNMVFLRALSWVLSSTSYIRSTFQPYSLNTRQMVTSMLTMQRRLSMVHPLLSLLLLVALMLSRSTCTS